MAEAADLHKRIKELEEVTKTQQAVIDDQIEKLEMAAISKTVKAETFTREGKVYKINHPRIIIPANEKSKVPQKVTSAEVAASTELQNILFGIEGCGCFTEVVDGKLPAAKPKKSARGIKL